MLQTRLELTDGRLVQADTILPACLSSYTPARIGDTCSGIRTVEQAIESRQPSLARLAREQGQATIATLLKLHLVDLDAFLKQKSGLTPQEIELIADEVMATYSQALTFADVNLIFRNAKLGRYGELYEKLTAAKVMRWFDDYVDQRLEKGYELSRAADERRYSAPAGQRTALMQNIAECLGEELVSRLAAKAADGRSPSDEAGYLRWKAAYQSAGQI